MENVKVYYFPIKALAEGIRMLLAYGDQKFEDIRISGEDWPTFKPSMPFGQMPVLEINGKKYAQTLAIMRFLGRKYGLVGDDIEQDFEIDQNVDFFVDIRIKASAVHYESDENVKAKKHNELAKDFYPVVLKKLDEIIASNNGHIALGKLTWGDFLIAGMYDCFKLHLQMPDLDQKYPNIKKIKDSVLTIPTVKAFCDAAPQCDW
ncbi:glutathione S-transferase 2-like [Leptidea sinapis]|uniref:glutathione S-transferase 2-like n=1 Tax=Leptidea sinapis TaxID=189913 RepID=UPI00212C7F38|nr:glutathione S-transferase 2-like [Leptidea sinapis]XP_050677254.1 glutathione S-transferase 2-like [Leptidea sinapis]